MHVVYIAICFYIVQCTCTCYLYFYQIVSSLKEVCGGDSGGGGGAGGGALDALTEIEAKIKDNTYTVVRDHLEINLSVCENERERERERERKGERERWKEQYG